MRTWVLPILAVVSLSTAYAKTYTVEIPEKAVLGSTQLNPGEYRLRLDGSQVVLTSLDHKASVTTTVKVENAAKKYEATEIRTRKNDSSTVIEGIELGGTRLRLDFLSTN